MKFALESKQVTLPSEPEVAPTVESISEAYEGLLTSYMELSDAQRNLDEVCQVMENIELSMKMIKAGGMDAVKLLNVDKSLEGLLGVAEEKMTVEAAQEGLGDVLKQLIEKVKEYIKKVVAWIREHWDNFRADDRFRDVSLQIADLKELNGSLKFAIPNEEVTVLSFDDMKRAIDNCAEISNYGKKLRNLIQDAANLTKDPSKIEELQLDEDVAVRYSLQTGKANELGWTDVSQIVTVLGSDERSFGLKVGEKTWMEMLGIEKEDQDRVITTIVATNVSDEVKCKVIKDVGKAFDCITRLISLRHITLGQVLRTASVLLKKARTEADKNLSSMAEKVAKKIVP